MGIGSPSLIKSQGNWCLRVVHVFETLLLISGEGKNECLLLHWNVLVETEDFLSNTPLWLRNMERRDLETKSHFNSHLHTSRSSLENSSEGTCARASLSSCTAFGIEDLMHWKAAILCWVLDVISWMPSSTPMNGCPGVTVWF